MEGFFVLDSEKDVLADKSKVDKMEKACSGSAARKRLADISNLPLRPKPLTQDEKSRSNSATIKEYIEKLQKENAALVKLLADRNKIIELSGAELHKLRVNLQKMQQQNLQLAQANSQMLAELNSGKDKQKMLQHELGCKNGLLIAQKLESEGKAKPRRCQKIESKVEVTKFEERGVCSLADRGDDKPCSTSRRQKSKSLGPSLGQQVHDKEKVENNRLVARRQSARFRPEEPKSTEHLYEIDHVKIPVGPFPDDQLQENSLNSMCLTVKNEDKEGDSSLDCETEGMRRSSIARPSRQAAKKVQSYKEPPLNIKMRRTE